MDNHKSYTTIGTVYDFIVEIHQKTGQHPSFPEALASLRASGLLLDHMPEMPPFHSGMSLDEFSSFIRGLCIYADPILPQSHTYMSDPSVEEFAIFPPEKDVFCYLNMPYMVELLHTHDFFEITYVIKGSCTLLFEGESATLWEGDVCIVSPGSNHSLPLAPGCLALSLVARKSTFDKAFGNLLSNQDLVSLFFRNSLYENRRANYILLKTGNDLRTLQAVQELTYESNLLDSYANSCAVSLLNLTLARALRAADAAVTLHHYEGYSQRDLDFALMLRYIQANYRTVTLSSLAETFHFSEPYLSKLIRKNLNQNFTDVLRTLKLNHAVDALMNTPMKIREIAEEVGYDSVDHFSRTFRNVYGVSPQMYRKRNRPDR